FCRLGVEGVAGLYLELVALEVTEDAVAVPAVDDFRGDLVLPGDDAAVENLELAPALQISVDVDLGVDRGAVQCVGHRLDDEGRSHLVAMEQQGPSAHGEVAAEHRLLEQQQARLGPEDLFLEVSDLLLE